jgi:hypothetical protein
MKSTTNTNSMNSEWLGLYKAAGISALLLLAIVVLQFAAFIVAPQPLGGTASDWFVLFQSNKLIGLIDFELLMIVYVVISIPISLALFILLRRSNPSWMTIYLALSFIGTICFISARPAFEMLYLSNGYTAAGTAAERAMFLAAGEAKLATFHGTTFHVSYILGSVTGLILSFVMLRGNLFSKTTAYMRIASSLFDFGLYVPGIGLYLSMFSVLFLFAWHIMIARRLFQFGKASAKGDTSPANEDLLVVS